MEQKKLAEVLKNKEFVEKIVKLQTPEEVQAAFKEKGTDISVEEVQTLGSIINKMVEKHSTELSKEDLEEVAGGGNKWNNFKAGAIEGEAPFRAAKAVFTNERNERYAGLGYLSSTAGIIATAIAAEHFVPWAYKKVKETWNSHKTQK
jgi:predicted ribosomally synthesized peptide with nif11-like leader